VDRFHAHWWTPNEAIAWIFWRDADAVRYMARHTPNNYGPLDVLQIVGWHSLAPTEKPTPTQHDEVLDIVHAQTLLLQAIDGDQVHREQVLSRDTPTSKLSNKYGLAWHRYSRNAMIQWFEPRPALSTKYVGDISEKTLRDWYQKDRVKGWTGQRPPSLREDTEAARMKFTRPPTRSRLENLRHEFWRGQLKAGAPRSKA
jgi:hypothetical protein